MSPRRLRMKKLAGVRERQLDEKVGVLNQSRATEERAKRLVEEHELRCVEAERARTELQRGQVSAAEWLASNEWLEERRIHREAAKVGAQRASAAAQRAAQEVVGARQALEQIRRLDDKLAVSEQEVEQRRERAREDEFAARLSSEKGRK